MRGGNRVILYCIQQPIWARLWLYMVTNSYNSALGPGSDGGDRPAAGKSGRAKRRESEVFTRDELSAILSLYGQFVAAGEWRDYAIDHRTDGAVFSIFRRSSEAPLYRIEKRPALAKKQGAWSVISMTGVILKRGSDLGAVLRVFDRKRLKLAASR